MSSYLYCCKKIKYGLYPTVQYVGRGYPYFHAQSYVRKVESNSNSTTATLLIHAFLRSFCIACIHYE